MQGFLLSNDPVFLPDTGRVQIFDLHRNLKHVAFHAKVLTFGQAMVLTLVPTWLFSVTKGK
jgi:hypothetical protein